jgi:hypothetical protein
VRERSRLAMPRDDGLGPDDDQTLPPRGKAVKDEGPEDSVPRSTGMTGGPRPQEDAELMPQSEVLGRHLGPRAKEGDEGPQKESNKAKHAERIRAENESDGAGPGSAGTSIGSGTYAPIRTHYGILARHTPHKIAHSRPKPRQLRASTEERERPSTSRLTAG